MCVSLHINIQGGGVLKDLNVYTFGVSGPITIATVENQILRSRHSSPGLMIGQLWFLERKSTHYSHICIRSFTVQD